MMDPRGPFSPFTYARLEGQRRREEERLLSQAAQQSAQQIQSVRDELTIVAEQIAQDIAYLDARQTEHAQSDMPPGLRQHLAALLEMVERLGVDVHSHHAENLTQFQTQRMDIHEQFLATEQRAEKRDRATFRNSLIQNTIFCVAGVVLGLVLPTVLGWLVTLWHYLTH